MINNVENDLHCEGFEFLFNSSDNNREKPKILASRNIQRTNVSESYVIFYNINTFQLMKHP